jgi:two-component system chemotaxis sensor kinase CheA
MAKYLSDMDNQDRLSKLFGSLNFEAGAAQAGAAQGQFPILDLLGNLRDEAAARPALAALHTLCATAWERMVGIVESGQPFLAGDIAWLKELTAQIQTLACPAGSSGAASAPDPFPLPPPVATVANLVAETDEELPLNLNLADDADLLREFITESREHLDNIEHGVLVLENQPADTETLNTVFRAFHTFKGGAGFLNLIPINRLAHVLESLLDLARQGRLTIDAPVIELILRGRDVLKQFLDAIEAQLTGLQPVATILIPTAVLKVEVQEAIDNVGSGKLVTGAEAEISGKIQPLPTEYEPAASVPTAAADNNSNASAAPAPASAVRDAQSAMVKVDTTKLDSLLDLVGEMVIAQSLVGQDLGQVTGLHPQFTRNMAQLARITKELQRVSMAMRMVPIRGVFQKMARVTRDLSAKQRKKIQFVTSGEDTELDRGVVEELNDPLLHMIRNSVDHGIETPEQRVAAGKPPVGTLTLRAYHQGGNIIVEISDDGAGLNRERILKKAVERGLIAAGATPTDEEVFGFIFAAGFSTAEKVTDVSGRGVGLDVVRRNLERLRGHVSISSEPGKGTRFTLALPLTLAIIDGLIVKVGEERYIIPTLSVRESLALKPGMISRVQNRAEIVTVRGRHVPLLRLHELFGVPSKLAGGNAGIVVVVQSGTSSRCLLVDALLHKQEVVIKNLNDMMVHKNRSLAGATILGDGRVGLILDVNALVHLEHQPATAGFKSTGIKN